MLVFTLFFSCVLLILYHFDPNAINSHMKLVFIDSILDISNAVLFSVDYSES